MSLGGAFLHCR